MTVVRLSKTADEPIFSNISGSSLNTKLVELKKLYLLDLLPTEEESENVVDLQEKERGVKRNQLGS